MARLAATAAAGRLAACRLTDQARVCAQKGIQKLKRLLEQEPGETNFTPDLYMHLYTCAALSLSLTFACSSRAESCTLRRTIYNMCTQKPPHDYSEELYARYRESFERYIQEKARPAAECSRDQIKGQ